MSAKKNAKGATSENTVRLARSVLRMALKGPAITEEELISLNVVNGSARPNVTISAEERHDARPQASQAASREGTTQCVRRPFQNRFVDWDA